MKVSLNWKGHKVYILATIPLYPMLAMLMELGISFPLIPLLHFQEFFQVSRTGRENLLSLLSQRHL